MTRSTLVFTATLALVACQPATDSQTAGPTADTSAMAGMDHNAMGHDMVGSSYTDLAFLDGMAMHHQMAVDMAQTAVTKAASADVRAMAQQMVTDQQAEIAQMLAWRQQWFPDAPAPDTTMSADDMAAMGMSMDMPGLTRATGPAYDRIFLQSMTPHHAGAITMAAEAQMHSRRPEVRALAEAIITAQAREIGEMQQAVEAMPDGPSRPARSAAAGQ